MTNAIRMATTPDASQIQAIYAPFCGQSPVSFEIVPPTVEEMAQRIRRTTATHPWLVCEREGVIRGYAYATRHRERPAYRWSVEVTTYVHEGSRHAGVGSALYTALFGILRCQGFYTCYAGITLPNDPSVALHKKLGFRLVGVYQGVGYKAGAWRDVSWWELELQTKTGEPSEPRTVGEIVGTKAWLDPIAAGERLLK